MNLAKNVNLEKYPGLKFVGQVRLYELARLSKDHDVGEFLKKKGVDCKECLKKEDLKVRLDKIDALIEGVRPQKSTKPLRDPMDSFDRNFKRFADSLDKVLQSDGLVEKINIEKIRAIQAKIENVLEKLHFFSQKGVDVTKT